ncbi:MAG: rhodanese-like domain-containing protein [Verrucomicrobiae bacterium]|nr:rhodanese-like domain-containing protein [Verrucomicrobiae bacterium]
MKNSDRALPRRQQARRMQTVLLEAMVVSVLGFGIAMVANSLSPVGLSLRRDYFPKTVAKSTVETNQAATTASPSRQIIAVTQTNVSERLAARGLRAIYLDEARKLFEDPRRAQELVVFIDARNDHAYQEGHIPGAYQFDHYYPARYLPEVLPACQQAETVIVYCIGGDCEDSEFAAAYLVSVGVPSGRIGVLVGGIEAWRTNGLPVEVGPRGSNEIRFNKQ